MMQWCLCKQIKEAQVRPSANLSITVEMVSSLFILSALTAIILPLCAARSKCAIAPLSRINSTSLMIVNDTLNIIMIDSEMEFETVMSFVSIVFNSRSLDCSEVISVVGELDLTTASIIHTLASRAHLNITLVSAVAPSTFLPPTNLALPKLLHLNPLTHYVEALAAFLDYLNWTRIGLVSENTPYHQFTAELVQQKILENTKRRVIPFVSVSIRDNKTKVVQTFQEYKTDVIFVSACASTALSLIQEAETLGLSWPQYAWIFFDTNFRLSFSNAGVILLTDQRDIVPDILATGFSVIAKDMKFRANRRLNNISIVQTVSANSRQQVGLYNCETQELSDVSSSFVSGAKPRGSVLKILFREQYFTLRVSLVISWSSILFFFVSIVLVIYLYFRKEPEIKATSVTVSLCMFLGCYILILYMPLLVFGDEHQLCNLLLWFSLGGIPLPLIISTIFFKVLRIFWILSDPISYKKRLFSDPCLIVYILLLMIPSFLILSFWSGFDPFLYIEQHSPQFSFIFVYTTCVSRYATLLLAVHLVYWILLCIVLIILALRTTEIRFKHFRDTKATNAFIYLTVYFVCMVFIFWIYLRQLEQNTSTISATEGLLYVFHGLLVVLCQILLFIPKVYPPLRRRLNQKYVKRKHSKATLN